MLIHVLRRSVLFHSFPAAYFIPYIPPFYENEANEKRSRRRRPMINSVSRVDPVLRRPSRRGGNPHEDDNNDFASILVIAGLLAAPRRAIRFFPCYLFLC